jgi:hypothetical protein
VLACVVLLTACAIPAKRSAAEPGSTLPADPTPSRWVFAHEHDERLIARLIQRSLEQLDAAFAFHLPEDPLEGIRLSVHLHRAPDSFASESTMRIESTPRTATIHLLAPSAYRQLDDDGWPRGYGSLWFHKNLLHEIGTAYLEALGRRKSSGWRLHEAPSWFVQGIEEELACVLADDEARRARYLAAVRDAPTRIARDFTAVEDVYVDGAVIVRYLFERFGRSRVLDLIANPSPGFWQSLESVLGCDRRALSGGFFAWLDGTR